MIPEKFLFFSLLVLSFLSLDEFGLVSSNHDGTSSYNNSGALSIRHQGINNRRSTTKDSNSRRSTSRNSKARRQKFLNNSENEYGKSKTLSLRKRDSNNVVHLRKQYVTPARINSKIHSQNPSNWKLDWDSEWTMEFAVGLASLHILPDGKHVTAYLGRGVLGRFLFLNDNADSPLSFVVTPCMSILRWSVSYLEVNESNYLNISLKNNSKLLETFRTQRLNMFRVVHPVIGVYMVEMRPLYSDTFTQVLVTTSNILEPFSSAMTAETTFSDGKIQTTSFNYNFNSASQMFLNPKILVKRLRGNRIQVKWESSPLSPNYGEYCIVVNTRRDYSTLCEAQGYRYGVLAPTLMDLPYYAYYNTISTSTQLSSFEEDINSSSSDLSSTEFLNDETRRITASKARERKGDDDFIIGCISKRTNYVLTDLKEGRLYYFNVFIRDTITNATYPYLRTTLKYRTPKNDSSILKDSKPVKIKLLNEPVTMQFFLRKHCTELTMYVMPCGGSLMYEIFDENSTYLYHSSSVIENVDVVKVAEVPQGRYFIRIQSNSFNDISANGKKLIRMAEIYLSKKNKRFPLPKLPLNTKVIEIPSGRSCDSITIRWWPSPDARDNEYCIFVKVEDRSARLLNFKAPNQCEVDRSLRNDPNVFSICVQRNPEEPGKPIRQKITGLPSGKTFRIQLIVRRHNRKALSYDLFHGSTWKKCKEK